MLLCTMQARMSDILSRGGEGPKAWKLDKLGEEGGGSIFGKKWGRHQV